MGLLCESQDVDGLLGRELLGSLLDDLRGFFGRPRERIGAGRLFALIRGGRERIRGLRSLCCGREWICAGFCLGWDLLSFRRDLSAGLYGPCLIVLRPGRFR
jgi:hypothetical protein